MKQCPLFGKFWSNHLLSLKLDKATRRYLTLDVEHISLRNIRHTILEIEWKHLIAK